jgi:membrane protein YqaA with SNARE-associated domain
VSGAPVPSAAGGGGAPPGARAAGWALRLADHPAGTALLFLLAVLEACVFPAPTEAAFVALGLARPRRSWYLAAVATVGSLVGATVGYAIGAAYFERVGRPLLEGVGLLDEFRAVGDLYRDNSLLALLTSGYTPIPYVLYTISAGASAVPLAPFLLGSLAGRGLKYVILSVVTFYAGPVVQATLKRAAGWVVIALGAALALWWFVGRR